MALAPGGADVTPPDTDGLMGRLLTMMGVGGVASGVADTLLSRGPAIVLGALASLVVGLSISGIGELRVTVTGEIATVVDWGIRGTLSYLPMGI